MKEKVAFWGHLCFLVMAQVKFPAQYQKVREGKHDIARLGKDIQTELVFSGVKNQKFMFYFRFLHELSSQDNAHLRSIIESGIRTENLSTDAEIRLQTAEDIFRNRIYFDKHFELVELAIQLT